MNPIAAPGLAPSASDRARTLRALAVASAALFAALFTSTFATGVSQQRFERVMPVADYGSALVRDSVALRALITVDDLFIAVYVALGLSFARTFAARNRPLSLAASVAVCAAGALDYAENHHILAMLAGAEAGVLPTMEALVGRSRDSALKWMLGHAAFVFAGIAMRADTAPKRLFRAALLGVQLPVGALCWTLSAPSTLFVANLGRAIGLVSGFAFIAWLAPQLVADGEPETSARE
jgi:hypothetical protein